MVTIDASQSTDPDGDALSYDWFYYREPSTFSGSLNLDGLNSAQVAFTAPVVMEAQTVHIILSVTDNGEPALTSYQRFVITIDPLDTSESGSDTAVNGIKGEYFSGQDFGELITTRVDAAVDFNWQEGIPAAGIPQDDFSVRWSGWIVPEYSEIYTFYTVADDGIRLYVNGELLVNDWQGGAAREKSGNIRLEAGAHYPILVEYFDNVRAAEATLFWSSDSVAKQIIAPEFYYVPVSEAAQLPEITYILPLGDSITESNGSHNSYRRALWHLLQENDYAVDFVGSQTAHHEGSAPNQDFDMDHEGHWGWRVDEILAQLPGWLEGYTPDVVLMHVGTNDIFQNRSIDETLSDMTEIVEALRDDNPEVTLLVAQVIPHNRSDRPALEDFNQAVMGWIETISTPESPAILVDQYTGFDPAQDTFDGVHPNPAGEKKMAQHWYEALEAVLPGS
jgi:lysophospholipase L1-like esterase